MPYYAGQESPIFYVTAEESRKNASIIFIASACLPIRKLDLESRLTDL
jgi:hypothetical protein